jgi:hypothetical protein
VGFRSDPCRRWVDAVEKGFDSTVVSLDPAFDGPGDAGGSGVPVDATLRN